MNDQCAGFSIYKVVSTRMKYISIYKKIIKPYNLPIF
jgi:hypothetical protein